MKLESETSSESNFIYYDQGLKPRGVGFVPKSNLDPNPSFPTLKIIPYLIKPCWPSYQSPTF